MSSTTNNEEDVSMMMPLSDGEQEEQNNSDQFNNNPSSNNQKQPNGKKKNRKRKKKKQIILPAGLKPFEKLYVNSSNVSVNNKNNINQNVESSESINSVNNVEYIQKDVIQEIQKKANTSVLDEFKRIFDRFGSVEELNEKEKEEEEEEKPEKKEKDLFELSSSEEEISNHEEEEEDEGEDLDYDQASLIANKKGKKKNKLKKKKKRKYTFTISQLKQIAKRPDVVEVHDITAMDPKFLVFLKSYKNTVSVPAHWSQKRKYLQGKRGFIKPPFKLPEFIAKTGIQKMREAYEEKENEKSIKQKMRDRVRPKLGKMDIDYQVLRDAFYKYQTKPENLSIHGDLYYEGKEYEQRRKYINKYKAGKPLTERLRLALGMPVNAPPPWLIKMQEHGPPPSYTNLRIPGLNSAIPEGASFGYHPGGWGRLPVDHMNRPLYNKFFGVNAVDDDRKNEEKSKGVKLWGEDIVDDTIEEEEEEEMESEEIREGGDTSDEEMGETKKEEEEEEDDSSIIVVSGLTTPKPMDYQHSTSSSSSSLKAPDVVNLRKEVATKKSDEPKLLYKVVEERDQPIGSRDLMGSSNTYNMPTSNMAPPSSSSQDEEDKKRKRKEKTSSQKKFKF